MKQVVVAFATTGNNPKEGHRFSELVAIEQVDGQPGRRLHLKFKTDAAQEGKTFADQFDLLDDLIGDTPIVIHHAGQWRKFLRPELDAIKKRGARRLLKQTVDVSTWAQQRFPKQRKDLAAIARKVQVNIPAGLTGIELEAEQQRLIATKMQPTPTVVASAAAVQTPPANTTSHALIARGFGERIGLCWRVLTGKA